jgi:hypothetical protein
MSQMSDYEIAQQLQQQFADNEVLATNQELASTQLAQQLAISNCSICQEQFEGERLLAHKLNDSHNNEMDCEGCRNMCTSCSLRILKTMHNKCPFTKKTVQFGHTAMQLLGIMMENLNINQEEEEEEELFQEEEEEEEEELFQESESEEEYPEFFAMNIVNVQWQRNQPCKYHFGLDGSILLGGGCHNHNCLFSHQQIDCRFGHNCSRRMTCIFKHNH